MDFPTHICHLDVGAYHHRENDYMRNSFINSKTIVPQPITYRKIVTGLINSKNKWSRVDTCRMMVGCRWCTYPSIHTFHDAGTLKITVGCQTSTKIQAFIFFTALTLSRPRPVACCAHFQAFAQNLKTRRGLLGPHCKRKGRCGRDHPC